MSWVLCVEVFLCVRLLSALMFFLVFVYLTVHHLFLLGHGLLNGMCLSTVSVITSVSRSRHAISSCSFMISAGGGVLYSWYLSFCLNICQSIFTYILLGFCCSICTHALMVLCMGTWSVFAGLSAGMVVQISVLFPEIWI